MIESINKKDLEHKIDQYVNGELSEQEIENLWAELIKSDYHVDYLKSVANLKKVIQDKRRKREAAKTRRYWSYSAAAAILLLVAVLFVFDFQGTNTTTEIQPVDNIVLDYYRSAEGTVAGEEDRQVIQSAIELANSGQFDSAIQLLEDELGSAEDSRWIAEINLNLGSLHYNRGNYQQARNYFEEVITYEESIDDVLVLEKAYWYLGNTYFQMDELDKARQHIEYAYELNGAYRRVARSYLNALSAR